MIEQPLLGRLPRVRFDTARREPRRVGRFPLIEWDGVFYSLPPRAVGHIVEGRQPVVGAVLELRLGGELVAVHPLAAAGSDPQWLPEHRAAAEAIALGRHGRHLRPVDDIDIGAVEPAAVLELGDGDFDVDAPDLDMFGSIGPHPDDPWGRERALRATQNPVSSGCECFGGGW